MGYFSALSKNNQRKSNSLLSVCLFLLFLAVSPAYPRDVRVGLYENYPKVFTSENGTPSGIFVDILSSIADDEGWTLEYLHGNWSECLERLESGEIDIMLDVAYSDARDEIFDFCENNVVSNWAQVYTRKGIDVDILTDLDSMSIATLRGGIHLSRLEGLIEGFGLHCEIIQVDDYETVFSLLDAGEVEAGVVNRVFGHANSERFNIVRSPVVFSPASLRYAVKAGSNSDLISTIDDHLGIMKANPGSIYHQSLRRWLGETSKFNLPPWIRTVLIAVCIIVVLLVSVSILMRYQVKRSFNICRSSRILPPMHVIPCGGCRNFCGRIQDRRWNIYLLQSSSPIQ